jgi:predicted RNA binding protein YcfA (HicA-like mRNA interferase family)
MSKLPVISGRQCVRALQKVGFVEDHQTGGHVILRRENPTVTISVPNHRELKKGALRAIIKQAGLSVDEFVELL